MTRKCSKYKRRSWRGISGGSRPDFIIGVPDSGLPLAKAVAGNFPDARYIQSQKETDATTKQVFDWSAGEKFQVFSFTRNKKMTMHTESIQPGSKILVVDDVIAFGHAGMDYIEELLQRGAIVVGLAAGWDKKFQNEIDAITNRHYIQVASTISVTEMLPDTHVRIAPYDSHY